MKKIDIYKMLESITSDGTHYRVNNEEMLHLKRFFYSEPKRQGIDKVIVSILKSNVKYMKHLEYVQHVKVFNGYMYCSSVHILIRTETELTNGFYNYLFESISAPDYFPQIEVYNAFIKESIKDSASIPDNMPKTTNNNQLSTALKDKYLFDTHYLRMVIQAGFEKDISILSSGALYAKNNISEIFVMPKIM